MPTTWSVLDYNGTGEFFPRPDLVGDPYAGMLASDNVLNLSAFAVPCKLDPGGGPRNIQLAVKLMF